MRNRYANAGPQLPMPEIQPVDDVVVEDEEERYYADPDPAFELDSLGADYAYDPMGR